jgi:HEAT repeat protein
MLKSRAENDAIRAALVSSLKNDRNPGVRLKALESLRGFEADALVRSALLEAAVRDGNPAVRIEAIDQLAKQRDQVVILTLQQLAERDPNTFIRMKSANRLREWNAPETTY